MMGKHSTELTFFLTAPHECNYIDDKEATSLFADPIYPKNKELYSILVENGFRRSGEHLYRPHCASCSECVPVRIPVNEFSPRRHQRRNIKQNQDVSVTETQACFNEEHFLLYERYLAARHKNSGMDNPTEENYRDFLWCDWSDTRLFEYRIDKKLIAVAVVDNLKNANSAVYTFFETEYASRGLGKYAILNMIETTKNEGKNWLYLGYWIASCQKMSYKIEYQPIECFLDNQWKRFQQLSSSNFAVSQ